MFSSRVSQVFLRARNAGVVWRRGAAAACRPAKSIKDLDIVLAKDRRHLTWSEREAELLWRSSMRAHSPPLRIQLRPAEVCPPRAVILPPCETKITLNDFFKRVLPSLLFWLALVYITYKMGVWSYTKKASDYITTGLMSLYLDIKGQKIYGPIPLPDISKLMSYLLLAWNKLVKVVFYPIGLLLRTTKCNTAGGPIIKGEIFDGAPPMEEEELETETVEEWLTRIVDGVDAFTEFTDPELSYRRKEEIIAFEYEKEEGMLPPIFEQLVDTDLAFAHMPEFKPGAGCPQYSSEDAGDSLLWMEEPTCPRTKEDCEEITKRLASALRMDEDILPEVCEGEQDPCECKTKRRRRFSPDKWCVCPIDKEEYERKKKEMKKKMEERQNAYDPCAEKRKARQEEKQRAKEEKQRAKEEKDKEKKAEKEKAEKEKAKSKPQTKGEDKSKSDKSKPDKEKAEKAKADKAKADKAKADKEKADKAKADKAKADKAKADKEKADKQKAENAKADKAKTDKEKTDKEKGDKGKGDNEKEKKEKLPECKGSKFAREIQRRSREIEEKRKKRDEEQEAREFAKKCREERIQHEREVRQQHEQAIKEKLEQRKKRERELKEEREKQEQERREEEEFQREERAREEKEKFERRRQERDVRERLKREREQKELELKEKQAREAERLESELPQQEKNKVTA